MTSLNLLVHPHDFRQHWRWITLGSMSLSNLLRRGPPEMRLAVLQISVALWGFGLATGVVYTLVEAVK